MGLFIKRFSRILLFTLGSGFLMVGYQNCGNVGSFRSVASDPLNLEAMKRPVRPSPTPSLQSLGVNLLQLSSASVNAGQTLQVTYNWFGGPTSISQKAFVHFLDASGNIAFKDDHYSPKATTSWDGAPFTYTRTVTVPTFASGSYKIAIGFYNEGTGERQSLTVGTGVLDIGVLRYQAGLLVVNAAATTAPAPVVTSGAGAMNLANYNPCATGACTVSGPIKVTTAGTIIRNMKISNPSGACIDITAANVRVENSEIGPCYGQAVITWASDTKVIGNYIHDTKKEGVYTYNTLGLLVQRNRMTNMSAGIRAVEARQVVVDHNYVKNVFGQKTGVSTLMGNLVQFDKVRSGGNRVTCNVGIFEDGISSVEDIFNMYGSAGIDGDPIQIFGNKTKGGGPSRSSGGIILGDGNGAYTVAKKNILVDPGQYGISVAGGHHQILTENILYARQQSFTNVGAYMWDLYGTGDCHSNAFTYNTVNYTNEFGSQNGFWNAGNCGAISGIGPTAPTNTNVWNAPINASIFDKSIPECE